MPRKIDISHRTIIFIALFILGLWIMYVILDLLLLLFVAIILTSALTPLINIFSKKGLPKALVILIVYILVLFVLGGLIASILPALIEQSGRLITTLPPLLAEKFNVTILDTSIIQSEVANISKNIYSFAIGLFSNFLTFIFLLVITFYLSLEKEMLQEKVATLFIGKEERVRNLFFKIEEKLGAWLRGQLLLTIIIGVTTYVGLTALGLPYALPLAIFAGALEVVPVIGPIIAAIPAVGLALTYSPLLAGGVAGLYFIIQQLENHIIVPQVMKRAVGLNPLVVILAIAIGGRLLGIVGGILAVPITVVVQIIISDMLADKK